MFGGVLACILDNTVPGTAQYHILEFMTRSRREKINKLKHDIMREKILLKVYILSNCTLAKL